MVNGISRQVIVVHAPDPKLFEQAIFILNENALEAGGVTDEMLVREAKKLIRFPEQGRNIRKTVCGILWAACGAGATALVWLLTAIL